jgi:rhodanese-related sulfurtransferase
MSQIHKVSSVSPCGLAAASSGVVIVDVRKPAARAASGLAVPGALWRHPFAAADWANDFPGVIVAVYCVHGHEVSQAVAGYLADCNVEARVIEGGFEAWKAAGLPVEPLENANV